MDIEIDPNQLKGSDTHVYQNAQTQDSGFGKYGFRQGLYYVVMLHFNFVYLDL